MLAEFEQAKRELAEIKEELSRARDAGATKSDTPGEVEFLKARALDLLRDIYGDSDSTLDHIKKVFESSDVGASLTVIERALKTEPPFRRALSSEEDGRTIIALIDAAVWRSRIVWGAGAIALVAAVVVCVTLGINVSGLSSQADAVRKFFDDARSQSQQSITTMNEGVSSLKQQAAEFEKNRQEIGARIDSMKSILTNPDSEVNKVVASFTTKLAQLNDIERDWDSRKVTLANALSRHEDFLSNKEADVTQKTSDFLRHAGDQIIAIESLLQTAAGRQKDIVGIADSAKRAAETIQAQNGDAEKGTQKIEGLKQRVETLAAEMDTAGTRMKTLQQDSETARNRIGSAEEAIGKRVKDIESAATTASANIDAAKKDFSQKGTQMLASLSSLESNAEEYAKTVQAAKDTVIKQQQDIAQLLLAAGQQETAITAKLEDIKSEQARQKGELDRANEIIKIVEDKRTDVGAKLNKMLDERPSLDSAAVWKLVLGSQILLALAGSVAILLFVLLVTLIFLIRTKRRRPAAAVSAAVPSNPS